MLYFCFVLAGPDRLRIINPIVIQIRQRNDYIVQIKTRNPSTEGEISKVQNKMRLKCSRNKTITTPDNTDEIE